MSDQFDDLVRVDRRAHRVETSLQPGRLVWRSWGTGMPLVLLHGGYGSWTHWLRNITAVAARYRVIVPDMPGFGESDQLNEEPSGFSIAGALVRGLDTIIGAHTAFQVAGFSFGGSIAGHIASLAPKRVERLVLIGSGGLRLPRPPPIDLAAWRHLDDAEAVRATHRSNLATLMFHDPGRIDDFAVAVQEANARRARFKSRPVSRAGTLHDRLLEITAPIGGIWGAQDATARGFIAEREGFLRSIDPDAEFVVIPDAGHWVQFEAAAQFNQALLGILSNRRARRT